MIHSIDFSNIYQMMKAAFLVLNVAPLPLVVVFGTFTSIFHRIRNYSRYHEVKRTFPDVEIVTIEQLSIVYPEKNVKSLEKILDNIQRIAYKQRRGL